MALFRDQSMDFARAESCSTISGSVRRLFVGFGLSAPPVSLPCPASRLVTVAVRVFVDIFLWIVRPRMSTF